MGSMREDNRGRSVIGQVERCGHRFEKGLSLQASLKNDLGIQYRFARSITICCPSCLWMEREDRGCFSFMDNHDLI